MKYDAPELLQVGAIEATVQNNTTGLQQDNDTDPISSRPASSILEVE